MVQKEVVVLVLLLFCSSLRGSPRYKPNQRELTLVEVEVRGSQELTPWDVSSPFSHQHPTSLQVAHKRHWGWNLVIRSKAQVGRRPRGGKWPIYELVITLGPETGLLSLHHMLSFTLPTSWFYRKRNGSFYNDRRSKRNQAWGWGPPHPRHIFPAGRHALHVWNI